MATTFATQQADCQGALADTTADTLTRIKRALNRAQSDFWYAKPWNFRRATAYLSMLATYETGTATFTQGSANVTGSGTTWTAAHTGMKIARSVSGPWYTFTRTGATTGTLDRNYVEADATAVAYVIYQDVYTLASTAEQILAADVVTHETGAVGLHRLARHEAESRWPLPVGKGRPTWWALHDYSSGNIRVRVGPTVPDTAFSVRYGHLARVTDLSADGDESGVPDRWRHVITYGALRELYLLYNRPDLSMQEAGRFNAGVEKAWMEQQSEVPTSGEIMGFDQPAGGLYHRFTLPVS